MGVRISNITETTTMADANTLPTDTTSGTRRISWANLKTAIFGAINGLTSKSAPVGADVIAIGDSAASFAGKKTTINELLAPLRNTVRAEKTTHTQYSSTIPLDNTIPQSSEGSEILTASITPTNASNYIRVRAVMQFSQDAVAGSVVIAALFKDSGANAICANQSYAGVTSNWDGQIVIDYRELAGSTTARTYKVRMGSSSGSTFTVSGRTNAGLFGGVNVSSLTVTEEVA